MALLNYLQNLRSSTSPEKVDPFRPEPVVPSAVFVACGALPDVETPGKDFLDATNPACYSKAADVRRPFVASVLALQWSMCILRTGMTHDFFSGFFMGAAILLGVYAWKESMHITFLCYWGIMSCFNGFLDVVKLADAASLAPFPLFCWELPFEYNFISWISVMTPMSELIGVPLAWFSYKDYQETQLALELEAKWAGTVNIETIDGIAGAFNGQGQRLGSAWDRT